MANVDGADRKKLSLPSIFLAAAAGAVTSVLTSAFLLIPSITASIVNAALLSPLPKGTLILVAQKGFPGCPEAFDNLSSVGLGTNPNNATTRDEQKSRINLNNIAAEMIYPIMCVKK